MKKKCFASILQKQELPVSFVTPELLHYFKDKMVEMKNYTQLVSLLKMSLLACLIFLYGGIKAQTTVNYVEQTGNFGAASVFTSSTSGVFNQSSHQMGMYAHGGGTQQVAAWRKFQTNGTNSGSNRTMQIGDVFQISFSTCQVYGEVGFALLAGPSYGNWADRLSNSAISFQVDGPGYQSGYGSWYAKASGGSPAPYNNQYQANSSTSGTYTNWTFTCTLIASDRMNVSLSNGSTTTYWYDVQLAATGITDYSVFLDNDWDGGANRNSYVSTSSSSDVDYIQNGQLLTFGQNNTSYTESNAITNGLVSNSTSTSSTNSLTKSGSGTLTLSGTNTYSGGTTISSGTLQIGNAAGLGASSGAASITSGAVVDLNGTTYTNTNALTINGTGISSAGALINSSSTGATYPGLLTLGSASSIIGGTGTISLSNTGTITGSGYGLTLGGTQGGTLTSILGTGSGTLTKQDAGTWTLNGASTYTGTTTVSAGILKLGNATALGTTANGTSISSGAAIDLNGTNYTNAEALTMNGTGISSGGALINSSSTGATYAGAISLGSASTVNGGTGSITLSGGITNAGYTLTLGGSSGGTIGTTAITGTGGLTVSAGTWTLSYAHTYSGTTTISGGTLTLGATNAIPSGAASVQSAVTINGGTLSTGASSAGYSCGTSSHPLGALIIGSSNGTIALASGSSGQNIYFAANPGTWSGTLTITGWTGSIGGSGTNGHIYFGSATGTLTTSQLANITFSGVAGATGALLLSTGECVPAALPTITSFSTSVNNGTSTSGYIGSTVTITGTNFTGASAVNVGSTSVSYTVVSSTSITFTATAGLSGTITVTTGSGTSSASSSSYVDLGYISTGSGGNWSSTSTWLGGVVPNSTTEPVTIAASTTVTMDGAYTVSSLTINSSGTFNNGTAQTLTIASAGTLTNNGTFTASTGSVSFSGTATVNGSNATTFNAVILNGAVTGSFTVASSGTITTNTSSTASGTVTCNGAVTINGSTTTTFTTVVFNGTVTGSFTIAPSGTITTNTASTISGTVTCSGSSTINGTATTTFTNLTLNGAATFTTAPTVNGNLQINSGGSVATNAPTYGSSSTLYYNTQTTTTVGTEWTLGATSNPGYPNIVTVGDGTHATIINFGSSSSSFYQLSGTLTIASGSTLTLSTNTGSAGLKFAGSFTNNGTFNSNGRGIWFVGASTQTLTCSNTLDYLILNGSGILKIGSNITLNASNTNPLQFIYSGGSTLDLNQNTLTIAADASSTILLNSSSSANSIISSGGTGTLALSTCTITATSGSLSTSSNVTVTLTNSLTVTVANTLTIGGVLQMNSGGYIYNSTSSPLYTSGSTLVYNNGSSYGVYNEWLSGITSGAGVPVNVQLGNGASGSGLTLGNASYTMTGNLTFSNNTGASLTMNASGGTLNLGGNWANNTTNSANFTKGGGTVIFNGTTAQTIGGSNVNVSGYAFNSITINNSTGVTLNSPISVSGTLTLSSGIVTTSSTNTLSLTNTSNSAISGGGTVAFVNGPLIWSLPNSSSGNNFIFPVGVGTTYLPFAINSPSGTFPVVKVQAYTSDVNSSATYGSSLSSISHSEYWVASNTGTFTSGTILLAKASLATNTAIANSASTTSFTSLGGTIGSTLITSNTITSTSTVGSLGTSTYFVFAVSATPVITSFSTANNNGTSTSGYVGTTVTISGTNLGSATALTVGGTSVFSNIVTNTATSITFTSISGINGAITVTNAIGSGTSGSSYVDLGYISTANGNWSSTSTWLGGVLPPTYAIVTINNNVTLNLTNDTVSSLTINSGATFTSSDGSARTLSINNSTSGSVNTLINNGTWANGSGASTVAFIGYPTVSSDAIHTVTGGTNGIKFNNVVINKTTGASYNVGVNFGTTGTSLASGGQLTIGAGGYVSTNIPSNFYTVNGNTTLQFSNPAGYIVASTDLTWPSTNSPSAINITAGTVSLNYSRTEIGTLAISGGGLTLGASLTVDGSWSQTAGTFTPSTYGVTLNGGASTTITTTSGNNFYNLTVNGPITAGNAFSVTNSLTIGSSGNLSDGGYTITVTGTTITNNGTHSGTGEIKITGSSDVTLNGSSGTYQNLETALTSANLIVGTSSSIAGNFTITSGGVRGANSTITFTGTGTLTESGTMYGEFGGSTLSLTFNGTTTLAGSTGYIDAKNYTVGSTGTLICGGQGLNTNSTSPAKGTITINGILQTSNSSGLWDGSTNSTTIRYSGGNFQTISLGGASTIVFNASGAQTISQSSGIFTASYYNLTCSNTGTKTMQSNLSIGGTLTLSTSSDYLSINGYTLTLNNPFSGSGTLTGSSTSNLTIAAGTIGTIKFTSGSAALNNLSVNGGSVVLGNAVAMSGTTTVAGGTLEIGVSVSQAFPAFSMSSGVIKGDAFSTTTFSGTYTGTGGTLNNAGTIVLSGTMASFPGSGVAVSNGVSYSLYNLTVAIGSGNSFNLSTSGPSVNVAGTLTLTSGLINTTVSNYLSVTGSISGASSSSYVNGPLGIYTPNTSTYTFPIGAGGNYRPVQFAYTSSNASNGVIIQQVEGTLSGLPSSVSTARFGARYYNVTQYQSGYAYKIGLNNSGATPTGTPVILRSDNGSVSSVTSLSYSSPYYTTTSAYTATNYALNIVGLVETAIPLTVTGATTSNKVYDGTTTASVTGGSLVGVVSPDAVTLTQAGTFASSAPGTSITITSTCSISGANSAAYYLIQPTLTARNITAGTAGTWIGVTSTNFSTASNWQNDATPASTDNITISSGTTYLPVLTASETINNLSIASGTTLGLNGQTLTINGVISGSGTITSSSTSSLVIGGTAGTLNFTSAYDTIQNLTLNSSATATLGNQLNVTAGSSSGIVTVGSGATLTTGGNLVLKSDINGTARIAQSAGTISGNVTVERYIPAKSERKYSFVASAVGGVAVSGSWQNQIFITGAGSGGSVCGTVNSNGFDVTQISAPSMFTYAATPVNGSHWVTIPNTTSTNLSPGTGYKVNIRGNRNSGDVTCANQLETATPTAPEAVTLSATGTVGSGTVTVNLNTNTNSSNLYTMLGNPYPCPISFSALQGDNNSTITPNLWLYSTNTTTSGGFAPSNYTTVNGSTVVNAPSGYTATGLNNIESGQSFFVQSASSSAASVSFAESHKTTSTPLNINFFGTNVTKQIRVGLQTTESNQLDEVVVRFRANGSDDYNSYYDAVSFDAGSQVLVALKGKTKLAISTLPDAAAADSAGLGVSSATAGTFQLVFSQFDGIDSSKSITLVDKYLHNIQDIRTNQAYIFNVTSDTGSYGNYRFEILFGASANPLPVSFTGVSVIKNTTGVDVKWSVVNELNIDSYEVERSLEGSMFTSIATTKATVATAYTIEDANIPTTANSLYYRIKSIGDDGSYRYSNVVSVKLSINNSQLSIYPNPVQCKLNITLGSVTNDTYAVRILTVAGKEVFSREGVRANGNTIALDVSNLAGGVYMLELIDETGNKQMAKFVKE